MAAAGAVRDACGVIVPTASVLADIWNDIVARDRQYLFLVLVGFLASFSFIRLSTRLMRSPRVPWWPGSIHAGDGTHVHHLVFGIVMMMAASCLSFAVSSDGPWYSIYAVLFGIGMGLTIDEYALWLRLEDVYWSREGRSSIDATLVVLALMGLALISTVPVSVTDENRLDLLVSGVLSVLHVYWVLACLAKQRIAHGLIGFFLAPIAIYGAVRIGKPGSPWARRFYGTRNPDKQARAEQRFAPGRRTDVLKERLRDAIGGVTEEEYQARLAAASAPEDRA